MNTENLQKRRSKPESSMGASTGMGREELPHFETSLRTEDGRTPGLKA